MYKQGKDLGTGDRVSLLSSTNGIATHEQMQTNYLVTDQRDKKGNAILVNTDDGTTVAASPLSVWQG